MGFLDPLFFTIIAGFAGLLGASTLGVSAAWLHGEYLYLAGCTYLIIRDWNAFSPSQAPGLADDKSRIDDASAKSYSLYKYWVVINAFLGITAMGLGLVGDERLSSSAPRKILDIVSSAILAGKTYEYEAACANIGKIQRFYLAAGLITPLAVGASKSAGLSTLFWVCQRWLNPSSAFFGFKRLFKSKIRLLPLGLITSGFFLALWVALRASGSSLENLIDTLFIRFSRNLDIYIFLDSLSREEVIDAFSESGGWIGGLLGGLGGSAYNIGSLAKAYSLNIAPDATGSNPRLHALIVAMVGTESSLMSLLVACFEVFMLSKLRYIYKTQRHNRTASIFNFVMWTSVLVSFHADVSSPKYGVITLIAGNFLLRIRTAPRA